MANSGSAEHEAAIAALEQAIAARPDLVLAHRKLAALLFALGRGDATREALRRAVPLAPSDAGLWTWLAQIETHLGDANAAAAWLQRAASLAPSAEDWQLIGHLHAEAWRFEEARNALERAAALAPAVAKTEALHAPVM